MHEGDLGEAMHRPGKPVGAGSIRSFKRAIDTPRCGSYPSNNIQGERIMNATTLRSSKRKTVVSLNLLLSVLALSILLTWVVCPVKGSSPGDAYGTWEYRFNPDTGRVEGYCEQNDCCCKAVSDRCCSPMNSFFVYFC